MDGKGFLPTRCPPENRFLGALSSLSPRTEVAHPFQCLTTLAVKKIFLIPEGHLPYLTCVCGHFSCHCVPLRRVWRCLHCTPIRWVVRDVRSSLLQAEESLSLHIICTITGHLGGPPLDPLSLHWRVQNSQVTAIIYSISYMYYILIHRCAERERKGKNTFRSSAVFRLGFHF